MIVVLPFPDKILWPNGRTKAHQWKAARTKEHKRWAYIASLEADIGEQYLSPVEIRLTVYPKARGPLPDQDNCIAAAKAYLDGIADAIGVNDRDFTAPIVSYGDRAKYGKFVVEVVCSSNG